MRHRGAITASILVAGGVFLIGWIAEPLTAQQTSIEGDETTSVISDDAPEDPVADDSEDDGLDLDGDLGDLDSLLDADLTQLAKTDVVVPMFSESVTTVSRQESTVGKSPAAIYVITGDMIRRSGARSIPEALRLAPGVNVARIDANKWAISIRGDNGRFANKLLVQIDGRTVYTPLFAGTFWDVQDVLLEDIARIEIIRGPGATVWGANAVNGVINVITKSARDTQGFFAEGGGGRERDFFSARIGGPIEGGGGWRVYGKWFNRDQGGAISTPATDDWHVGRLGFRADWDLSECDNVTLQGDYYDGDARQHQVLPSPAFPFMTIGPENQQIKGGNVLMRWTRTLDEDTDWSLQMYYDRTERTLDSTGFREDRDTVDVDFQHRFRLSDWQSIIWGFGYRNTSDSMLDSFNLRFVPRHRADDRFGLFVQDQMTLKDDLLFLTLGSKFSWNDYTGFEIQPTARLLYTPTNRQSVWASFSRAVRVPSRASDNLRLVTAPSSFPVFPTFPVITGNRSTESEDLLAWEIGMRMAPTNEFSWDVAAFFNQYDDLHQLPFGTPFIDPSLGGLALPINIVNGGTQDTYGFEAAATWQPDKDWTLRGAYSFLRTDTDSDRENPRNQLFLHSSWDLTCNTEFDLIGRYTDSLPGLSVPAYFEMDARFAYRPCEGLEMALVGRNLLDNAHPEFANDLQAGALATQVQRELYGVVTWRF